MRMTTCESGHYYDNNVHKSCPYCIDQSDNFHTMFQWADQTVIISRQETSNAKDNPTTMTKGKCGHYYDSNVNTSCPYCIVLPVEHSISQWVDKIVHVIFRRKETRNTKDNNTTMTICNSGHYHDSNENKSCLYRIDQAVEHSTSCEQETRNTKDNNSTNSTEPDDETSRFKKDDLFDKYIIQEIIEKGGFSVVYKVKHKYLQHGYALKIFERRLDTDPSCQSVIVSELKIDTKELKKLFLQEAKNLSCLNHPNVVKVFDAGVFSNKAYILLEYIDKTRLDLLLDKIKYFTIEKTLDLLEDISSALVEQEKMKIIHSDIKPSNIFLRKNNTFCLIDYGNMNTFDIQSYTKNYASPEHFNKNISHQGDLFLLGLTAWSCLSGEVPKSLEEWNFKIPPLEKYRNDIPKELLKIIYNLIQIEPSKRYKTAKNLQDDIYNYRYHDEEPIGSIQGTIFVAISYNDELLSTYNTLKQVSNGMNLKCIRMDKIHFQDEIWKNIALEIEHSNVIIADFSEVNIGCGANPNVITEASHARAKGKDIIIITQNRPEDLPFDWRYLPIVKYSTSKDGLNDLSKKIYSILRVLLNNKNI